MDAQELAGKAWTLVTGDIITMDPLLPRAEAMLVNPTGRIHAIGRHEDVGASTPPGAEHVHAPGTVVPGFIDSHFYLQRAGLKIIDLFGERTPSIEEFQQAMADTAGDPDWSGGEVTNEVRREGLRRVQPLLHGLGVTGVVDPWATQDAIAAYQLARRADELSIRVTAMPYIEELRDRLVTIDEAISRIGGLGIASGFGDETLALGAFKIYVDGEGRRCEALREAPWPGTQSHGVQAIDGDDIAKVAEFSARHGWSLGLHAIGGKAMRIAVEALEQAALNVPELRERRFRLIHAYLEPSPETMRRAASLGVILSAQPAIQWVNAAWLAELLPETGAESNPLRSWIEAGVRVVLGSDGPYFPFDPCELMWFARTRAARGVDDAIGPQHALTPEEALAGVTANAAYMAGVEHVRGTLAVGRLADWVELSRDPLAATDEQLRRTHVRRTVVGGRTVFEKN